MDPAQAQPVAEQNSNQILTNLKQRLASSHLPPDVAEKLQDDLGRIELVFKTGEFTPEFDRQVTYMNFVMDFTPVL